MSEDCYAERLSFVGRKLADRFACRWTTIDPGAETPYMPSDWTGALVVVEEGDIEIECLNGVTQRFSEGAVIVLDSLPIRALRNPGHQPALLVAVSRTQRGSAST